jgi:hypothetical protein
MRLLGYKLKTGFVSRCFEVSDKEIIVVCEVKESVRKVKILASTSFVP